MGERGMGTPAMPHTFGAQIPVAATTRSVLMLPRVVWTPVILPPTMSNPVTLVCPWNDAPRFSASFAIASAGRIALDWMSFGT